MMDGYLMFLPVWVAEGCAEYTQMLPYNAGTFRAEAHKNAIKDAIASWRSGAEFDGLERHMKMTREQWQKEALSSSGDMARLYHRSQLLIYYFCHLDGDRRGTRFMEYMEAVYGQVAEMRAFFADPRVKQLGGGRFSYPEDMKLPDMNSDSTALKNLATLVGGRSYQQLAAEIEEGYRTIGVRIEVTE
jgi:hypothetical protein